MNISGFFSWFLNQFITIATFLINKLDQIYLIGNVSLLDFIITITIIGIFVSIVLTLPQNMNRFSSRAERRLKKSDK